MTVYLAGPIAGCTDAECKDWRALATEMLDGDVRDPMRRDYRAEDALLHARQIVEDDKRDIAESDVVLAYLPKVSVGTSMEIIHAYATGKPVVTVVPPSAPMSPWVLYHSTFVVEDLSDGVLLAHKLACST